MREFQILRYLAKGKLLIFIIALVGALGVYYYASTNQTYTAVTAIRYANDAIDEGLTPNGSKLDVSEIYSTTVISGAIEDLGLDCTVDEIRSRFKVEPIISEEEEMKKQTAIDKGDEYNYFPTDYKITYSVDNDKSMSYARYVLDAVLKNYYRFYSERYVDQLILPNNAANIKSNDYDYIDSADIIEDSVTEIYNYLTTKRSMYPDFRASATGYTFTDLENIYNHINNNDVPGLYASILEGKYTKDNEVLLKKNKESIDRINIDIANNQEKSDKLLSLINNYSEKGINSTLKANQDTSNESDGSMIIQDVEENFRDESIDVTTTYDDLIQEYVSINQAIKLNEIDKQHYEYIRSVFENNPKNVVLSDDIDKDIDELVAKLNDEYLLVRDTATELNEYIGANYLKVLNSIVTTQAVNTKLYLALSLVLFLFIGCAGAVVVGRISDFVQYILYTDKKTKLPNRQMCDMYIDTLAEKVLDEECTCIVIKLKTLNELNEKVGHSAGDMLLSDFGRIIKFASKHYGFMGYNGVGQFIGIFEQCAVSKAELFIEQLSKNIKEYNEKHVEVRIKCSVAFANSTDDEIYDIRALIRRAFRRMK
ncbi:MAG: diguanylate cyclase [Clostridia bacterium]|nr:diguanylate cyclase [Clostridia bacterium]